MPDATRSYIPAAGHDWLLPFYDTVQSLLGGERVRAAMLDAAGLRPDMRVLDVGCGTGSLLVALKQRDAKLEVAGLDPDPLALARARRKLERVGLTARLDRGYADALPYADAAFERVFSSFMFHHLERDVKEGMLREVRRVLAPEGAFHLVDFGGDAHARGILAHFVHSHDALEDNFSGAIPALMAAAGFGAVSEVGHHRTLFGGVAHYMGS